MAVGAVLFFYFAANAHAIIKLATRVTKNPVMVLMAILAVLSLMELCRRCVGIPILCVVGALLVYTFATVRFGKVIYDLFYTTSGVMNTPINVCAKYIVVFIIFGAFLERTGISNFFIDLANCLCGSSAGGPAKVAVISSALCGMVSGSSVGNTVTTGSVTIPMMKKMWLPPGIRRSSGGGCFDRRADHAANHGRCSIPDGRIYGRAVCDGGAESDSSGSAVFCGYLYRSASGGTETGTSWNSAGGTAADAGADETDLSAGTVDCAGGAGIDKYIYDAVFCVGSDLCRDCGRCSEPE